MISRFLKLNKRELHTFSFALSAYLLNGISLGIIILQEVILKKTLGGTPFEITILTMIMPFSNFFSVYFAPIIKKSQHKSLLFMIIGIFGRMSLVFIAFINTAIPFMLILFVYFVFNAFLSPLMNSMLQLNIRADKRGKLFGYMNSLTTLAAVIVSIIAGKLLDIDENFFKLLFTAAGISGFVSCYLLSKIRFKKKMQIDSSLVSSKFDILYPFKNMLHIFKNDKKYLFFESSFFVYGMGFLVILPALPIFFVDVMKMDYTQISMAKGVIGQFFMVLIMPFIGSLHDRTNPMIFSSVTFFTLAFYPLILILAPSNQYMNPIHIVYISFFIFSLAMSGVIIVWNLGSIYFAGNTYSSDYQSIHVTLTGVRGLLAPLLGYLVIKYIGVMQVFYLSSFFFFISSFMMILVYFFCKSKDRKQCQ
ncbi:MFS transporter [candidate division WOR-3 bacterium]|nr:MFS transporter [candidate division WOR-3 bacterium]